MLLPRARHVSQELLDFRRFGEAKLVKYNLLLP